MNKPLSQRELTVPEIYDVLQKDGDCRVERPGFEVWTYEGFTYAVEKLDNVAQGVWEL